MIEHRTHKIVDISSEDGEENEIDTLIKEFKSEGALTRWLNSHEDAVMELWTCRVEVQAKVKGYRGTTMTIGGATMTIENWLDQDNRKSELEDMYY